MSTPVWTGGTLYPNGSIVRPTAPSAPGPATISNPTFDAGTTGWDLSGVAAWSAANGFTTPGCVEMTNGVGGVYLTAFTATTPGQSVTASCMIATPNGSAGSGGDVNINWYDASDVFISQSQGNTVNRSGGTGYRQSTVTASAPAGAVKYKIGADVQTAGSGAIVRVDNFTTSVSGGAANDFVYRATQPGVGTSASSEPVWPTILGGSVVDGTVTWEAVYASRITYVAEPILKSGATEPTWPIGVGTVVSDGTILWTTGSRQVTEAPNSKIVVIGASKVFAGDDDIIRYSATVNPLDWTSTDDAGYLPFGLQNYGSNPVAAMGLYRGNLIAFNSESFQQWQIDPDPANMALLDAVPIGSTWHKALSPVANDLFFLAAEGVRTVGIAGGSTNLQAGDAGMPIDPLVRAATLAVTQAAYAEPLGMYFPSMGQYLLSFSNNDEQETEIFVHSQTQLGKVGAWTRYELPFNVGDWSILGDELYLHTGSAIHVMRLSLESDEDSAGVEVPIVGFIQSHYLDMGAPGVTKQIFGFDMSGRGQLASISFGLNQATDTVWTPPAEIPVDSVPGMVIPIPLMSPSFAVRISFSSADNPGGWEWLGNNLYLQDMRRTS